MVVWKIVYIRTFVAVEGGKVLVRPRMGSDHMSTTVRILDAVHRSLVVNAIPYANMRKPVRLTHTHKFVQLFPSGAGFQ